MREDDFRAWLQGQGLDGSSISSRVSSIRRVIAKVPDLEQQCRSASLAELLSPFDYNAEDRRMGKPNPSPVEFTADADIYNGLASIRQALKLYRDFLHKDEEYDLAAQKAWLSRLTRREIDTACLECNMRGLDAFLAEKGLGRPQSDWFLNEGERYPVKATIVAAVCPLPDGPQFSLVQSSGGFSDGEARERLVDLGYELDIQKPVSEFSRDAIEEAMDAFDQFEANGFHAEIFNNFKEPKEFWVRSTRQRSREIYPTKPLVGFILNGRYFTGGWSQKDAAAARLHNAGYVIVNAQNQPIEPPEASGFLMSGADRVRAVALNYFIAPARDESSSEVTIRAKEIADMTFGRDLFPNICQALGGQKFLQMAGVPAPINTVPNPSSTTAFTYQLSERWETSPVIDQSAARNISPENIILYGPPGTGKTYRTAWEAVRLCHGAATAEALRRPEARAALMEAYKTLVAEGRVEFVTFHQSMSYEEFVEGLRPVTGEGAGFSLEPVAGVFRRMAERAKSASIAPLEEGSLSLDGRQIFKMSIGRSQVAAEDYAFAEAIKDGYAILGWENIDFSDARYSDVNEILRACREEGEREGEVTLQSGQVSQVDSFRNQMNIGDIVIVSKGNTLFRAIGIVTGEYFHKPRANGKYTHFRSVDWRWVDEAGLPVEELYNKGFTMRSIYMLDRSQLRTEALEHYLSGHRPPVAQEPVPHVLIIDEINRANISKVFGELITLLEPDKRIGMENEIRLTLPYSKASFGVPANLHMIGTMNTADRSIALLDTALRRRFTFRELMPDPSVLGQDVDGINLRKLLATLNERIEYLFDREHQIGHAYFTGCKTRTEIEEVIRNKVIPLLAEYFFEDWAKVAAILGDGDGGAACFISSERLAPPRGMVLDEFADAKRRWVVRDQFDLSEFKV